MTKKWEVLKSEYIHKNRWLTARKDCVRLPNGKTIEDYYVLEYPDWVNVVAVTKDNKFVFVEQYRHGLEHTGYELCAGVIEDGEEPLAAAKRELLEETGYGGGIWEPLITLSPNTASNTNLNYSFTAVGVEKIAEPRPDETEDVTPYIFTLAEVKAIINTGQFKQALHIAPLLKYLYDNKL